MSFLLNFKKYLRELQRADDQRKKRWLISTSTISIISIIILWVVFFNLGLKPIDKKQEVSSTDTNNQNETFWQTINRGAESIKEMFNREIKNIKNIISKNFESIKNKTGKTNDFSVENEIDSSTSNFTPLPKTPLP
ncbi:MAG: hypothetical protein QMD50_02450 [Patescibacteria group bacterium]|nr:hypothetical protein [Patescibacteria group bacterium]